MVLEAPWRQPSLGAGEKVCVGSARKEAKWRVVKFVIITTQEYRGSIWSSLLLARCSERSKARRISGSHKEHLETKTATNIPVCSSGERIECRQARAKERLVWNGQAATSVKLQEKILQPWQEENEATETAMQFLPGRTEILLRSGFFFLPVSWCYYFVLFYCLPMDRQTDK